MLRLAQRVRRVLRTSLWSLREPRLSGVRHARLGKRIEFKIVGQAEIRLGDQVRIDDGAILGTDRTLQIGARSYVGPYATIYDSAGLSIGEDVLIGPHAVITAGNHRFERLDIPINRQDNSRLGIKIEDDVWVGANAVVLDGVTVGHGAVVAAGAVVTRDVAPFAVVAGVPAREISVRGGVGQALG